MSSRNSLEKAIMRPGDFGLRRHDRQLFGNYVELSPVAGGGAFVRMRKSASVVETPPYDEPRLWRIDLQFSAPLATPPLPLTPWAPALPEAYSLRVTVRAALDRDKRVATRTEVLDATISSGARRFSGVFQAGHQVGVSVEALGTSSVAIGVQASIVDVTSERDGYGNAEIGVFAQSNVSQVFLLENGRRRQFFVQNMGSQPLYVAFGPAADPPTAVPPSFTFALPNLGDVYESPRDCYQGIVSGVWAAAGGATDIAVVTEGT